MSLVSKKTTTNRSLLAEKRGVKITNTINIRFMLVDEAGKLKKLMKQTTRLNCLLKWLLNSKQCHNSLHSSPNGSINKIEMSHAQKRNAKETNDYREHQLQQEHHW